MKLTLTTKEVKWLKKEVSRDFDGQTIFDTPELRKVIQELAEESEFSEAELHSLGGWLDFNIDMYGWETREGRIIEPILNKVNTLVWG